MDMLENNKKNKIAGSFIWRFLERCGAQGVSFIVSIVLARLLDPDVYGVIALVTVFTTIMQVFVDSGMGNALIQKKDADELDFSSVFYFNMITCVFLYACMFFAAPLIAGFYENNELIPIIRVLSLSLIISGVKNVQQAYVSRHLIFKKFFYSTIGGTIGAAVVGITMAYLGFGVWALVAQQLFNMVVGTVILWITVPWKPKKMFSFARLKGLMSFGWKLLCSSLIDTLYNDVRQLIIGKKYSSDSLAYYNKGNQFPVIIVTNINSSIDSVLFPTMSKEQEDRVRVKAMTQRAISMSTYLMAPLMIGMAAVAEPLVSLILTDKWLGCVPFLRIFCITYLFYPIHSSNLNAIKAMGRSDYFFRLEIIKKVIGMAAVLVTMWISVEAMAYSLIFTTITSTLINAYPNKKLLDYRWSEQMKDILPGLALALIMGVAVFALQFLPLPTILVLAIQVVVGAIIYLGLSVIFKIESFKFLLDFVINFIKKRKKQA